MSDGDDDEDAADDSSRSTGAAAAGVACPGSDRASAGSYAAVGDGLNFGGMVSSSAYAQGR